MSHSAESVEQQRIANLLAASENKMLDMKARTWAATEALKLLAKGDET